MTPEQAEAIVEAFNDLEGCEASVYSNYSGRGMFGEQCTGIVVDSGTLMQLGYAAGLTGMDSYDLPTRQDQLGHGTVVY